MADQLNSLPIQKSLIDDTQALAEELDISWSRLVALALSDFVRRHQGRKQLVDKINAAYADAPDDEEIVMQRGMRATQRNLLDGEIVINKYDTPVARLLPIEAEVQDSIVGWMKGSVKFTGDIVTPLDEARETNIL